jgi:hypothetical protein
MSKRCIHYDHPFWEPNTQSSCRYLFYAHKLDNLRHAEKDIGYHGKTYRLEDAVLDAEVGWVLCAIGSTLYKWLEIVVCVGSQDMNFLKCIHHDDSTRASYVYQHLMDDNVGDHWQHNK